LPVPVARESRARGGRPAARSWAVFSKTADYLECGPKAPAFKPGDEGLQVFQLPAWKQPWWRDTFYSGGENQATAVLFDNLLLAVLPQREAGKTAAVPKSMSSETQAVHVRSTFRLDLAVGHTERRNAQGACVRLGISEQRAWS
jgi:hypothetical protein